jgi:hypothetical protein
MQFHMPKEIHIVKCDGGRVLGVNSVTFGFYNPTHAATVVDRINRNRNVAVWYTDIKPNEFLLHPRPIKPTSPKWDSCKMLSLPTEEFLEEMSRQNLSIRLIDTIIPFDKDSYTLYSACGFELIDRDEDDARKRLAQMYKMND